jgi:gas vesicle protein
MRDSASGSFFAGVLIGGLIGAALGLLLAPQSGERLRGQMGDFVDTRRSALGDAVSEGRAAAEQARAEMATEPAPAPRSRKRGGAAS